MSHLEHLQRGSFLREAGAVQRANSKGPYRLTEIAFPDPVAPDDIATAVVTTSAGTTVQLATTATRDDLYAALKTGGGWATPAAEAVTPPPATTPPPLVYADLLTDLGEHLFLLTNHPADLGRPDLAEARLNDVRLIGEASAVVELTTLGTTHRVHIALDSGVSLDVVPLVIAELLMTLPQDDRSVLDVDWEYPNRR